MQTGLRRHGLTLTISTSQAMRITYTLVTRLTMQVRQDTLMIKTRRMLSIFSNRLTLKLTNPQGIIKNKLIINIQTIPRLIMQIRRTLRMPNTQNIMRIIKIKIKTRNITQIRQNNILRHRIRVINFSRFNGIFKARIHFLIARNILGIRFISARLIQRNRMNLIQRSLNGPIVTTRNFRPPSFIKIERNSTIRLMNTRLLRR